MADELDTTSEITENHTNMSIDAIRTRAQAIPAGNPGECAHCGEFTPRLVNGACARCRDRLKLG